MSTDLRSSIIYIYNLIINVLFWTTVNFQLISSALEIISFQWIWTHMLHIIWTANIFLNFISEDVFHFFFFLHFYISISTTFPNKISTTRFLFIRQDIFSLVSFASYPYVLLYFIFYLFICIFAMQTLFVTF